MLIEKIDISQERGTVAYELLGDTGKDRARKLPTDYKNGALRIDISKRGLVETMAPDELENKDKRKPKIIPKDFYYEMDDEMYSLGIKHIHGLGYIIPPIIKSEFEKRSNFNGDELEWLKELFIEFSVKHRGIDYDNFQAFMYEVYGIKNHIFEGAIFNFFDWKKEGVINFVQLLEKMNVIYKGTIEEKAAFVFEMLDIYSSEQLGLHEINYLFNICYIDPLKSLQDFFENIKHLQHEKKVINPAELYNDRSILDKWEYAFLLAVDREDDLKFYISALQLRFKFDLEKLDTFWTLHKSYIEKNYSSIIKSKNHKKSELELLLLKNLFRRDDISELDFDNIDPFEITKEQFKIFMIENFNISDVLLLDCIFDSMGHPPDREAIELVRFFENFALHLKGSFDFKLSLILDVYCVLGNTQNVPHLRLLNLINSRFEVLHASYRMAVETIRRIGFNTENPHVTEKQFINYMMEYPEDLDFMMRLTLGPYRQDDFLLEEEDNIDDDQLRPNLQLVEAIKDERRANGTKAPGRSDWVER